MRNRQVYEKRHLDNWRAYSCVAFSPLFPRLYLPTGGQFNPVYSVRSARMFASGILQPALTGRISAFRYTSALSTCDWTSPLIAPFPHDMLDARFGFGTLAERTSKQPGKPGTQPDKWTLGQTAASLWFEQCHLRRSNQRKQTLIG